MKHNVHIKRIYEQPQPEDGLRVLIDRVWPRGMTKERARADLWFKEAAPSADLRKWFCHDRSKWEDFKIRYIQELESKQDVVAQLLAAAEKGPLTLLFSAKDVECNQAVVLCEYLRQKMHGDLPSSPST